MSIGNSGSATGLMNPKFLGRRYRKEHPHFVRNVIMDAVISGVIVGFATYAITSWWDPGNRQPVALKILGEQTVSIGMMKQMVTKNNLVVYWLGGSKDSLFTVDYSKRTAPILSYMTPRTLGEKWGVKIVSIQSFVSNVAFKQRFLGRIHQFADTISIDSHGDKFLTNPDHATEMVVDIAKTDRVVIVDYLTPQPIPSLKSDAESLTVVK